MYMNYVMTDLHGEYGLFKEMLDKISFSDKDTLYILGDCCDRGENSAEIYLDLMNRKNVFAIRGNHEEMALEGLEYILENEMFPARYCSDFGIRLWFENGGDATVNSLYNVSKQKDGEEGAFENSKTSFSTEKIRAIYDYISSMPYYMTAKVGEREFLMVHAGLSDFDENKPMDDYSVRDLVWQRPNFNAKLFSQEHKYLLVGHTPTFTLTRSGTKASIYRGKGDIIGLDCGATYSDYGGRLACLCLETMEVVYVSK